ncbi:MAG: hypothetical protein Q8N98_00790 [bacterium]|nr:hypothetical protein [bacterium]
MDDIAPEGFQIYIIDQKLGKLGDRGFSGSTVGYPAYTKEEADQVAGALMETWKKAGGGHGVRTQVVSLGNVPFTEGIVSGPPSFAKRRKEPETKA